MEILVIGNEFNLQESRQKFGDHHHYHFAESHLEVENYLKSEAVILDFKIGADYNQISVYQNFSGIVFLDVMRNTLDQMIHESRAIFYGFCGLPTFLNREILEVSLGSKSDENKLKEVCRRLNTKFAIVKDQVGLVTPRVICQIINEAYFAIEEKIASRSDIDLAMKLGTNYPYGPFEWGEKIGIKNVYELLRAIYESSRNERYKICELLRNEALD